MTKRCNRTFPDTVIFTFWSYSDYSLGSNVLVLCNFVCDGLIFRMGVLTLLKIHTQLKCISTCLIVSVAPQSMSADPITKISILCHFV